MQVEHEPKAVKDLKSIAPAVRARIVAKIVRYADAPESLADRIEHRIGPSFYQLRIGDCRAIFEPKDGAVTIMVVARVRYRRETYD